MDDLVSFIVFLLFVGGSIVSSIAQAKKKRKAELEEALEEPSPDPDETFLSRESEPSSPRPAPQTAPRPVSKNQGWEELKRQLERMVGETDLFGREEEPDEPVAVPPPKQRPRAQAFDKPAVFRKREESEQQRESKRESREGRMVPVPSKKEGWKTLIPKRGRSVSQPARQPASIPAAASRPKTKPQPAPTVPKPSYTQAQKNPLSFHPDPIANAILLSEILGRRHRNPVVLPRPTYPSR